MNLFEKFVSGAIVTLIIIGVPKLYKKGEKNKIEHIKNKKIYYGVFRMIGLYLLAIMSGEMVLMLFLGNSGISGVRALLLTIICSVPVMILYLNFYKNHYKKLIEEYHKKNN